MELHPAALRTQEAEARLSEVSAQIAAAKKEVREARDCLWQELETRMREHPDESNVELAATFGFRSEGTIRAFKRRIEERCQGASST